MTLTSPIPLLLARDVTADGTDRNALTRRTRGRSADLLRIRRGVYVSAAQWKGLYPGQQHLVRVCASLAADTRTGHDAALAHESAAVAYGLPLVGQAPERVTYVRPRAGGTARSSAVARVLVATGHVQMARMGDTLLTSPAQTLVDLARLRSLASSLASMDHALRHGMVTKDDLYARLAAQPGVRGNVRARRAIGFADGRSESVGESLSRAVMIENHLPAPELQVEVFMEGGVLAGRVDFMWRELGVAGEFDGRGKYRGDTGGRDVAMDERHRENHVELFGGVRVVRWGWRDAYLDGGAFMLLYLRAAGVRPVA